MAQSGSTKKVANSLVTTSCAAVLAVYVAGYVRTQSAADRFTAQIAERRPAPIATYRAASPREELRRKDLEELTPATPQPKPYQEKIKPAAPAEPEPTPASATPEAVPAPLPAASTPIPESDTSAQPVVEQRIEQKVEQKIEQKAEAAPPAPPAPTWKDGTYTGWGYSRHGNIEASVVIDGGRIASATISQCRTRYSCSVIERLPPQVAQRQSPDVDYVSGATQSADAFYGAVVAALNKAK
jgi:uncharacterized protein with FMN-binding domain